MDFVFRTAVWGDAYTDLFLEVTLPTILAECNLPRFAEAHAGNRLYNICTTHQDAMRIKQSRHYAHLRDILDITFVYDDTLTNPPETRVESSTEKKYNLFVRLLEKTISTTADQNAFLIGINPDVYSNHFFPRLLEHAKEGKKLVYSGYFRVQTESFVPAFLERLSTELPRNGISSRQMIALGMSHLHNQSERWFWDNPGFRSDWPAHTYQRVGDEGFILNGFHLGAVMLKPPKGVPVYPRTADGSRHRTDELSIDGNSYLTRAFPDENEIHFATDSDELCYLDMLSKDTYNASSLSDGQPDLAGVAYWMSEWTNPSQRHCFRKSILFHKENLNSKWRQKQTEAEARVDVCFDMFDAFEKLPALKHGFDQLHQETRKNEESASLLNVIGLELYNIGLADQAAAVWQKASEIYPGRSEYLRNLSMYHQDKGDFEASRRFMSLAHDAEPSNVDIAKILIAMLFKENQLLRAKEVADELLGRKSDPAIAHLSSLVDKAIELNQRA